MPTKTMILFLFSLSSCTNPSTKNKPTTTKQNIKLSEHFSTISSISLPDGYERLKADSNSFGFWLRNLTLKQDNTVYKYNGEAKKNQTAQFAVIDISIGNKNLQQCADAVMRLRAEYLFAQKKYSEIIFWDNEHHTYAFSQPYTHEHLLNYLQTVFGMCGSASLSMQLKTKPNNKSINPGDVLIRGGFPGHAVIVTDVAIDKNNNRIYQIAQSYMPAQSVHILKNPSSANLSPWYYVNDEPTICTPEYTFKNTEWKMW